MTNIWSVTLQKDEHDVFIPFPEQLLESQGWKLGDTIELIDNENGSWTLMKKETK